MFCHKFHSQEVESIVKLLFGIEANVPIIAGMSGVVVSLEKLV